MSQQLKILKGLPASGKSTFAVKWVQEDPKNRVRVNRDDLRRMSGAYWVPQREDYITKLEQSILTIAIEEGYSVIWDNTNFRVDKEYWQRQFKNVNVNVLFLDIPLETCIERDQMREEGRVGKSVIEKMYNKYLINEQKTINRSF